LVAALVWAATGCWWTQVGSGPGRAFDDRFEPVLNSHDIGRLTELWSAPIGATPIIAQGAVFGVETSTPGSPMLTARNVRTGAVRWAQPLPTNRTSAPAYHRGFVYLAGFDADENCVPEPGASCGSSRGALYSFDARTGEPGPTVPQPVLPSFETIAGEVALTHTEAIIPIGAVGPRVQEPVNIDAIWIHPWSSTSADRVLTVPIQPAGAAPVIDEARRLLIASTGEALSLDCTDPCTPTWTPVTGGSPRSSTPDAVVLARGGVVVLDPTTGAPLYASQPFNPIEVAARRTSVWVRDDEGVVAMYADCGQDVCPPVWLAFTIAEGQPVLGGDLVYVPALTEDGAGYAVDVFLAAGCGEPVCQRVARVPTASRALAPAIGEGVLAVTAAGDTHVFGIR
jgi:outer membrane protein assembly factor BamB